MATTVKESFRQYTANLNITDRQETVVSTCRNNVVTQLREKLQLHSEQPSKLIGSYDRDTLTRYLKEGDVDVMIVLNYGNHKDWDNPDGTTKALNRFRDILTAAYPDTPCKVNRNCVTMALSQFRLDVVPAFQYESGSYSIPDTYRKAWLSTDPVKFAEKVTQINKTMNGTFVPLIKMVKGWNRNYKNALRGFHIECLMVKHYESYTQSYTYESTLKVFFSNLPAYLENPAYDPITGDRVDLYLDNAGLGNDRETFVNRTKKAAALAAEAYEDGEKYPSVAIEEWKKLFGEFFPAYG